MYGDGTVAITKERYLGLSDEGLVTLFDDERIKCLPEAKDAFLALRDDASKHGFDLQACSAFRSFDAQARIFTAKFLGERPILDINEVPLNPIPQDPIERIKAILLFSAMPGFSRHHFGSDFDIYAPNKLPEGQKLQLTYHEYLEGSYFYELGLYLKENLSNFGFANPYQPKSNQCLTNHDNEISKGDDANSKSVVIVGFEPWHISHVASARPYLKAYDASEALAEVERRFLPFSQYAREVMSGEQIDSMLRFAVCQAQDFRHIT